MTSRHPHSLPPPEASTGPYHHLTLCVPPQFHTLQDGNALLAAYGSPEINKLSEHFGRLSARTESFGARSNEALVASECLSHAARNSQVNSVGISVYSTGRGFGPHFDKRFEAYGCNTQVSPNLDSTWTRLTSTLSKGTRLGLGLGLG